MHPRNGRLLLLLLLIGIAVILALIFRGPASVEAIIQQESLIRARIRDSPITACALAFAIYVVATAFSLPIATGLTLVYAWLFGFWRAVLVVSFASTAGATLAFLSSRYLLRDWVQERFGAKLAGFNEALARDGAYFLITLRLVILVPFWLVNLLMGLTPIRTWTFWWVSQLGMLPATCIYAWTGGHLPSLEHLAQHGAAALLDWKLITALSALGVFPWIARAIVRRTERRRSERLRE